MMLNQVPGQLGLKLTISFELVHNSKPDSKTWFKLFSIGYFNHDTYNAESCSKLQAHTLYGIAVGRDDRSNSIIFYNPITSGYYRPPDFRLDESRLPITNFPNSLRFDGGLTCGLLSNNSCALVCIREPDQLRYFKREPPAFKFLWSIWIYEIYEGWVTPFTLLPDPFKMCHHYDAIIHNNKYDNHPNFFVHAPNQF